MTCTRIHITFLSSWAKNITNNFNVLKWTTVSHLGQNWYLSTFYYSDITFPTDVKYGKKVQAQNTPCGGKKATVSYKGFEGYSLLFQIQYSNEICGECSPT